MAYYYAGGGCCRDVEDQRCRYTEHSSRPTGRAPIEGAFQQQQQGQNPRRGVSSRPVHRLRWVDRMPGGMRAPSASMGNQSRSKEKGAPGCTFRRRPALDRPRSSRLLWRQTIAAAGADVLVGAHHARCSSTRPRPQPRDAIPAFHSIDPHHESKHPIDRKNKTRERRGLRGVLLPFHHGLGRRG